MPYSGTDELRVMELAVRYNGFLAASISSLVPPPGPILDFGAGLGSFAKRLRSQGYEIHCLEPDEFLAKDLVRSGFKVYRSQDEIADNHYSAIYTLNVLEHIQHDKEALSGLVSKLRAKGRLLIYVPAFPLLYSAFDAQVGHYRRYRLKQVTEMLHDLGCSIENRGYVDSLGFFLALLYKWLGSNSGSLNPRMLRLYDSVLFPLSRVLDHLGASLFFGKNIMVKARRLE